MDAETQEIERMPYAIYRYGDINSWISLKMDIHIPFSPIAIAWW